MKRTNEVKRHPSGAIEFSTITVQTTGPVKFRRKVQEYAMLKLLERHSFESASRYASTIQGNRTYMDISRFKAMGVDMLAERKPGSILDRMLERFDTTKSKRPTNAHLGQWLGVEIECIIPFHTLEDLASKHRLALDGMNGNDYQARRLLGHVIQRMRIPNISVHNDGSLRVDDSDDEFSVELTVLCTMHDRSNLKSICDLLATLGARINKSCGLHVHLDSRDLLAPGDLGMHMRHVSPDTLKQVSKRASRLGKALGVLQLMVPESRRRNSYCKLAVSRFEGGRYFAVNKTAFMKYGTIEVRLHGGTTNFDKISNWIDLLYAISRSRLSRKVSTFAELTARIPMPDALKAYLASRIEAFSSAPVADTEDVDSAA